MLLGMDIKKNRKLIEKKTNKKPNKLTRETSILVFDHDFNTNSEEFSNKRNPLMTKLSYFDEKRSINSVQINK
ncbi:hypothetical protein BpHYR1_003619 [Brachionus plicatilis]|uniref:Uncharacterized protein n=1 Tax=Brachionus plicatilis TaxID=10195 RepID=A0A3M7P887_BRAPC|nr:hypothetical protein BpHYR1_003619 [Brachionus plicatilis]